MVVVVCGWDGGETVVKRTSRVQKLATSVRNRMKLVSEKKNIKKAFESTGIHPLNPRMVLGKLKPKGAFGSPTQKTVSLENDRFRPFQNGRPLHRSIWCLAMTPQPPQPPHLSTILATTL